MIARRVPRRGRAPSGESGAVLVTALVLLVLLDLVLCLVLAQVVVSVHGLHRARDRAAAFNAAEAGLAEAVQRLAWGEASEGDDLGRAFGTASFELTIRGKPGPGSGDLLEIRSTGKSGRLAVPLVLTLEVVRRPGHESGRAFAFVSWREEPPVLAR